MSCSDLKPANILIDDRGTMKLCDLGLATASANAEKSTLTIGLGSKSNLPPRAEIGVNDAAIVSVAPGYCPPEAADPGKVHVDPKAWDVYSLAMILLFIYTKREPFDDDEALNQFQVRGCRDPTRDRP
jgi:serine/threonine protein kinase